MAVVFRLNGREIKRGPAGQRQAQIIFRAALSDLIQRRLEGRFKVNVQHLEQTLNTALRDMYRQAMNSAALSIVGKIKSAQRPSKSNAIRDRMRTGTGTGTVRWQLSTLLTQDYAGGARTVLGGNYGSLFVSNRQRGNTLSAKQSVAEVRWRELQPSTLKRKGSPNANLFFKHRERLQAEVRSAEFRNPQLIRLRRMHLRDARGRFISRTEAEARASTGIVELDNIRAEILPNVPSNVLPSIRGGVLSQNYDDNLTFESQYLGLSEDALVKLGNGGRREGPRHLLQPVISYYTLFAAPQAISRALSRYGFFKS